MYFFASNETVVEVFFNGFPGAEPTSPSWWTTCSLPPPLGVFSMFTGQLFALAPSCSSRPCQVLGRACGLVLTF